MVRKILVVKIGGREIAPGLGVKAFAHWAAALARSGHELVIVHGGGDEVSALAAQLGLPTVKVDGQRVTTPAMLPLVVQVLAGEVNSRIVRSLRDVGLSPLGLTGLSGDLLIATPLDEGKLGLVGKPLSVSGAFLEWVLDAGHLPVIAPIAPSEEGTVLNINADLVASAVASALGADLVLVTDVDGVRDPTGHLLDRLTPGSAEELLASGTAHDGMVPKLQAAVQALSAGASSVWIGRLEDAYPEPQDRRAGTFVVPDLGPLSLSSPPPIQAEGR